MRVKAIKDEDFVNYKVPCMFISTCFCDWKCCHDANIPEEVCQNNELANMRTIDVSAGSIYRRYITNPISEAIVVGGLEPMKQFNEIYKLIEYFRFNCCRDYFVIYTGYNKDEITDEIRQLSKFKNIIIKFGRFIPNQEPHYDHVLGINLISDNQYAEVIS